jgi:hypothetical protein
MDRMVQRLSMMMARSTTRRGLLSRVARATVGVGLGAGFIFGGSRYAFAAPPCSAGSDNGCAGGTSWCTGSGDVNGCYFGDPVDYCGDCAHDAQGNITGCGNNGNSEDAGSWSCCCNGEMSECTDCGLPGQGAQCVCNSKRGSC